MRIVRKLGPDRESIQRFLSVFGGGMIALSNNNKYARPEFFIQAHIFIKEYIEGGFFKKEELLIRTLANVGFPTDDGPLSSLRNDQNKSRNSAELLIKAANQWQAGDEEARAEVGWAASEYSSMMRQHLDQLKNLIFPLIEQNIPLEREHQISEEIEALVFEGDLQNNPEKYEKLIVSLEEELGDWR